MALASSGSPTTTAPAPTAETDPPAQVRTETVHRTVHVNAPARSASSDDDGTLDQGPGDAPRTPAAPAQGTVRHDAGDGRRSPHGDDDATAAPVSSSQRPRVTTAATTTTAGTEATVAGMT